MATVEEAQLQLEQRRQQIETAQRQVQQFQTQPEISQSVLRKTRKPLAQRTTIAQSFIEREKAKQEAQQNIQLALKGQQQVEQQVEQQVQEFQASSLGKAQVAQQLGYRSEPLYMRSGLGKGQKVEIGKVYYTPSGKKYTEVKYSEVSPDFASQLAQLSKIKDFTVTPKQFDEGRSGTFNLETFNIPPTKQPSVKGMSIEGPSISAKEKLLSDAGFQFKTTRFGTALEDIGPKLKVRMDTPEISGPTFPGVYQKSTTIGGPQDYTSPTKPLIDIPEKIVWVGEQTKKVLRVPLTTPGTFIDPFAKARVGERVVQAGTILETSSLGWTDIGTKVATSTGQPFFKDTESYEVPLYQKETLVGSPGEFTTSTKIKTEEKLVPTAIGLIPTVAGKLPEISSFILAPAITTFVTGVTQAEKLKDAESLAKKELKKQWNSKLPAPEGFEYGTYSEFEKERLKEMTAQIDRSRSMMLGAGTLTAGVFGGLGLWGKATKPIVSTRVGEQVSTITGLKGKIPVNVLGKEIGTVPYNTFQITTVTPSVEAKVSTWLRDVTGYGPKFDWTPVTKPKVKIYRPSFGFPVVGDIPYSLESSTLLKSGKLGRRTIYDVGGQPIEILPGMISRLPKTQQYEFEKLTEKMIGRPVKKEIIPKMFKEDTTLISDLVEVKQYPFSFGQVRKGEVNVFRRSFPKEGKGIKLYETATFLEPVGGGYIKVGQVAKDVTKPGARATGNLPYLSGYLKDVGRVGKIELGKGFEITGTGAGRDIAQRLTPQQVIQLTKSESKFVVPTPIVSKPRVPRAITVSAKPSPSLIGIPKMVGGTGLTNIPYAGTAKYEQTFGMGVVPTTKGTQELVPIFGVTTMDRLVYVTGEKTIQPLLLDTAQKPRVISLLAPTVKSAQETRFIQIPKEELKLSLIPRVVQQQVTRQVVTPKQRVKQPTPTPKIPKPRVPRKPTGFIIPKMKATTPKVKISKGKGKELFVTQIRRRGKFFDIGKAKTLKEAISKGVTRTDVTLAASYRIKKGGQLIKTPIPMGYVPSKRDPFVAVEKSARRISTYGEKIELKQARRKNVKFIK